MAKHNILLIGDGTNLLKTIGWVLDYKGFAVKVTACPEAALEALVKKNYDLVIAKLTNGDRENLDILARANGVAGDQEGSQGNDTLQGSETNDTIYGFDGNDSIRAHPVFAYV